MVVNFKFFILLISFITSFAYANDVTSSEFKEKGFLIVQNNLKISSNDFEKQSKICDELEKNTVLDKLLFENIKLTKKDLGTVLLFFSLKANQNCVKNEYNQFLLSYNELINFYQINNFDNKKIQKAKDAMSQLFGFNSTRLKTEILYERITDDETKKYLESLEVLKKPFNVFKTLGL